MRALPILKGLTIGACVGAVSYVIAKSSPHQKKVMKRDATRTARAVSDLVNDFSGMIR